MAKRFDLYEESDLIEVAHLRRIAAIYWTLPVNGARANAFSNDVSAAAAISFTVFKQREQVERFVAWSQFEIAGEVALEFDNYKGLQPKERERLDRFIADARLWADAVIFVNHHALAQWRPNHVLDSILKLNGLTVLAIMPPSELVDHFRWNRHWKKHAAARSAARRAKSPYQPMFTRQQSEDYHSYMGQRIAQWSDWQALTPQQKMERLRGDHLKTISGLRFEIEHVKNLEAGLLKGR